jgi:hypothetical protein
MYLVVEAEIRIDFDQNATADSLEGSFHYRRSVERRRLSGDQRRVRTEPRSQRSTEDVHKDVLFGKLESSEERLVLRDICIAMSWLYPVSYDLSYASGTPAAA